MDEVITAIKAQIEAKGIVAVAHMLCQTNTQSISRWVREGKIPEGKLGGIRAILEANKIIKAKRS
jgi:hypothetical protein